ncbi:MAG: secretin and TonB N-terminal domain-containing protein [Candidatus Omnitrophica bacterium]|nr:secretin and TonB N-terminal domain-containing protein [Candidatus Omnitrophota bacterium]
MFKNKIFVLFLIFAFIGYYICPLIYAQRPPGEGRPPAEGAEESTGQAQSSAEEATSGTIPAKPSRSGNVTMDFKDADINNVLRILSYKGGVNIVAGPEVSGLVTIRLTDVPWDKALDIVLRTYGFAYDREGNIIRVTTIESLKQEELSTEVYSLSFAKAEEVAASIGDMLTDRGKIKYDERTNVVVATDIATNLYKIGQIIKKLDRRTPQVLIEAKIIETKLDDSERLGIDWETKISATGAAKPMTLPFTRLTETDLEQGFDKFFAFGSTAAPVAGDQFAGTTETEYPAGGPENWAVFPFAEADAFTFGTLDFTQFQAVLEFIRERTDTDVLSNPRITTLNNKEASILVGSQMMFPSFSFNEETGDFIISGFQDQKDLGVKLTVTPHINKENDIVVKLKPEIKSFSGIQTLDASRGIVAPIFETREAETEVMVRDGDTIMLGGLITKETTFKEHKVPFLGTIPFIGDLLFTKKEEDIDRKELIIFITVHLVKDRWETHLDPNIAKVPIPLPKDAETFMAMPRPAKIGEEGKKKRKWWELW